MNQKNRAQKAELQNYLERRCEKLTQRLEKLYKQMDDEGFSSELFTQINVAEYSLTVCQNRKAGNIADPRYDFELSVPKIA